MEVEKISPVATSPLDSCRGRGKHLSLPRLRPTRPRPLPKAASTCGGSAETPTIVMLVIQEPQSKVGTPKDGISTRLH
jgi:hypothetical protein